MTISRRGFIRSSASVAAVGVVGSPMVRGVVARAGEHGRGVGKRCLVVVELNGGNDALNTVIPIEDPLYATNRPTLAIGRERALMLEKGVALHPAMTAMHELYRRGQLAVIQGVGYPNPSRSHFRSMDIWHRGHLAEVAGGWLGQAARAGAYYGGDVPEMFKAEGMSVTAVAEGEDDARVVRRAGQRYPQTRLGAGLAAFAEMIERGSESKLFYISQGGFDTHARQAESHGALLGNVSSSIGALLADLRGCGRERDVMVMVFSEFGRRLRENSSAGTDHGTAGVMFFAGGGVAGGLYGRTPNLGDLREGDLRHTVDFRDCYATVLEGWLGVSAESVLADGGRRMEFIA